MSYRVLNPEYRQSAQALFKKAAFVIDLGIELETIELGLCASRLRITPRHLQQHRFIHAAVQAAIADHTAGGAAQTLVAPDETVLTIEYKINLLRPAVGQLLRATARVLRPGRSISVVESEVFAIGSGGSEALTSKATVTLAVVKRTETEADPVDFCTTRDGYDRWAEIYDDEQNPLVALEEPEIDRLFGDVRGLEIADVGCGTGRHARRLAAHGARVTGIDFSEGMLAKAREKCAGLPSPPNLIFHDLGTPLPFADQSFDRVLSALVLDHVPDLAAHFRDLSRVCRSAGSVIVSVMHPAMMLRGVEARFRDPRTGRETRPKSYPYQIADYLTAASTAGLRIERIEEHAVREALAERLLRARKYLDWPMLLLLSLKPPAAQP